MSQHPNTRLTPRGRMLPCERLGGDMRVSDAAAMADASRQIAHKRLARARRGEAHATRGKGTEKAGAGPTRTGRRDEHVGPHLRQDRGPQRPATPERRRPHHRRAARPRLRHARALRAQAPRRAVFDSIKFAGWGCGGNLGPNPSYAASRPKSLRCCMGLL